MWDSPLVRLARVVVGTTAALVAAAVTPRPTTGPVPVPVPTRPPPATIGDAAERWVHDLRPHHGPDEECSEWDCRTCWIRSSGSDA